MQNIVLIYVIFEMILLRMIKLYPHLELLDQKITPKKCMEHESKKESLILIEDPFKTPNQTNYNIFINIFTLFIANMKFQNFKVLDNPHCCQIAWFS